MDPFGDGTGETFRRIDWVYFAAGTPIPAGVCTVLLVAGFRFGSTWQVSDIFLDLVAVIGLGVAGRRLRRRTRPHYEDLAVDTSDVATAYRIEWEGVTHRLRNLGWQAPIAFRIGVLAKLLIGS